MHEAPTAKLPKWAEAKTGARGNILVYVDADKFYPEILEKLGIKDDQITSEWLEIAFQYMKLLVQHWNECENGVKGKNLEIRTRTSLAARGKYAQRNRLTLGMSTAVPRYAVPLLDSKHQTGPIPAAKLFYLLHEGWLPQDPGDWSKSMEWALVDDADERAKIRKRLDAILKSFALNMIAAA